PMQRFDATGSLFQQRNSICDKPRLPRASGQIYGTEIYLLRRLTRKLSGWLSYTLSKASAQAQDGTKFTPEYDIRHLFNAVLQYDWGAGFRSGVRAHYQSGRVAPDVVLNPDMLTFSRVEKRLPAFFRIDLGLSYSWRYDWAKLRLMLEWQNLTLAREAS